MDDSGTTYELVAFGCHNMESILSMDSCQDAANRLIESALTGRAKDNITAIVVHIEDDQPTKTQFNPTAVRVKPSREDDDKTIVNK